MLPVPAEAMGIRGVGAVRRGDRAYRRRGGRQAGTDRFRTRDRYFMTKQVGFFWTGRGRVIAGSAASVFRPVTYAEAPVPAARA